MTDADPVVADFAERFPDSFARALRQGSDEQISTIVETLPAGSVASIAARLPAGRLLALLESGEHSPKAWLQAAPFDDAVMLLSRMRRERRIALIDSLDDRGLRRRLMRHQQYPTHSAGFLVEEALLRIDIDAPVSSALTELRGLDRADMPLLVVIDAAGRYAGVLHPWRLINDGLSDRQAGEFAEDIQPIAPETPVAAAATHEGWLQHNWLPVVDNRQRLLGALSRAALFRAARRASPSRGGTAGMLLELVNGLTLTLGEMLDGILTRRPT